MSQYTTEVRFICEQASGLTESVGFTDVDEVIDKSWRVIFGTNFPIFDEEYREHLCKKILQHYYTREIAYETPSLWIFKLRVRMNEIMPYYNQMYKSAQLEFDPFKDFEYRVTHEGEDSSTGSNEYSDSSNGTTNNVNKYSETPQNGLQGVMSGEYLTTASVDDNSSESSSTSNSESTASSTNKWNELLSGKRNGDSYSKLLQDYRNTFINVDLDIINSLSDLFFNLWA
jgi:hypothetical protein